MDGHLVLEGNIILFHSRQAKVVLCYTLIRRYVLYVGVGHGAFPLLLHLEVDMMLQAKVYWLKLVSSFTHLAVLIRRFDHRTCFKLLDALHWLELELHQRFAD
ncbi:hypothetical protein HAX54_014950 [Datura stramonium]|uniref:Uncharacterized protein n=1 Tax=Datura stramonium TaxID=4076 RepID=A0ABS8TR95_DATST|nr:hypothetical protein [Datura stramonium]